MSLRSLIWGLLIAASLAGVPRAVAEDAPSRWSHVEMPFYPALLRNLKIGGHVKLIVTLTSDGKVRQATVRGGNPMLAELSCMAVKKWIYSGTTPDKNIEVELLFDPNSGGVVVGGKK